MQPTLRARAAQMPVLTLTGPRQAGKTTLCRDTFPGHSYLNLERPDTRAFAQEDPRGLLDSVAQGAVIDEVQRVPDLLSWVQVAVDEDPRPGRFILTGSHSFELMAAVSQSLAGRTALLHLLPLSLAELRAQRPRVPRAGDKPGHVAGSKPGPPAASQPSTNALLHGGGYPRIWAQGLAPQQALGDYFATYVERDLRQLIELRQLDAFRRFVKLAAGRVGQVLNLHGLASDAGVSDPTAKAWVGLLEASYIVRLLPPWHANIGKRLVKSPKLYFCDVGLAAWLIGIQEAEQLATHPLRGALFENLVVMEFVKHALNAGQPVALHHFRDSAGLECDLVVEQGLPPGQLGLVEIKSGQTLHADLWKPLQKVAGLLGERVARRMVVYGGPENLVRDGIEMCALNP
jgi:predicted AAA+ superfamily ATPase